MPEQKIAGSDVAAHSEVIALEEKFVVVLNKKDMEGVVAVLATLAPEGKTSMIKDVEAK